MAWLWKNPIATMPGPFFLPLFAAFIALVIIALRLLRRVVGANEGAEPPRVPASPDPYQTAFLAGGANEVLRTVLMELVQTGAVKVSASNKEHLVAVPSADVEAMNPLQRSTWTWLESPRTAQDLFSTTGLKQTLEGPLTELEAGLRQQQLLVSSGQHLFQNRLRILGIMLILALGGYKLTVALAAGKRNVGFLIPLGIIGAIVAAVQLRPTRLTAAGKEYLKKLKTAFSGLKSQEYAAMTPRMVGLTVALFGISALDSTIFADYHALFKKSLASGGGDGSGGSSCGSSGCGSGCGGGGCGGCGGGD